MSLRLRLALTFALVAFVTAGVIALATPAIVDRGFGQLADEASDRGQGQGLGPGPREGRGPGRAQRETTIAIIVLGVVAGAGASVLGFLVAGRLVSPLEQLKRAAAELAAGDLERRSDVADRTDEIGDLGRSFDSMAESLERSDAIRRRLFQDAAHELKTPLTVIDATTTAILDGVYEHDDRHLRTIRSQSQLLSRIVDDLRTVSLAEAGRLPLDLGRHDAAEVVREAETSFGSAAELAGIALTAEVRDAPLWVVADRQRLAQMVGALVDNAVRHTPRGGHVVIEGHMAGHRVELAVRDDGPGIPVEDLPNVYERFYRVDPAPQQDAGTSGLGLSIVRALAVAQGGDASVENVAPHGARFVLSIPGSHQRTQA
ncbi:MAG: HAMP domain-containing sensor histidine kinase [Candidatus Limnocylindrales bacterium]